MRPNAAMTPTLTAVRLERTRDVLREFARSVSRALPIAVGIAGPLVVAVFGLLAWAGLPVMKAPTMAPLAGGLTWCAQTAVVAWPLLALRRRLLPVDWCVQLRCLPVPEGAMFRSDLAVAAVVLSPVALAYVVSGVVFTVHGAGWWRASWPIGTASALASWAGSCGLGAAVLALRRRHAGRGHAAHAASAVARPGRPAFAPRAAWQALLWAPSWRDAMAPGGPVLLAGVAAEAVLAAAWTRDVLPVVPNAAWAFVFSALALALAERAQRAMERHVDALRPFLVTWPMGDAWRWQARVLPPLAAVASLLVLLSMVMAWRPWRPWPVAGFTAAALGTWAAMGAVPADRRETHVALWALGAGLCTALGSELWITP